MPGTISQVRNTVGRGEVKSTNVYRCRTLATPAARSDTRRTSLTGADAAMASLSWDQVRGQSAAALRVTAGRQPAPLSMLQATLGRCCSKIRWKRLRGRRTAESTTEALQSAGLHESCSQGQVRRAL